MFERYSERARRVVFYARYEAAQFGSPDIDTEHLLLGLLRAGKGVVGQVLQRHAITVADLRRKLPGPPPGEPVTHSVDLPLSAGARRILAYAGEEAELMHHDVIEVGHLLLGILREEASTAAQVLIDAGLTLENARRDLVDVMARRPASPVDSGPPMEKLVRFLSALDERDCRYQMSHPARDAIRVELTRRDERWEIDFHTDGRVKVRVFTEPSATFGEDALTRLFDAET